MAQGDLAVSCDNVAVDVWTLLASCIGEDGDGKKYLRTVEYTQGASEADGVTCNTNNLQGEELFMNNIRSCIVKNSENKNALRLGIAP